MKHLKQFKIFENSTKIDEVTDFIQPSNPMESEEYRYYCFGDDEAYYGGISLDEFLSAIEGSVFREESDTSKKFGWDFINSNKQEILDKCKEDLLASGIKFTDHKDKLTNGLTDHKVGDKLPNGITITDILKEEGEDYWEYVGTDDNQKFYLLDKDLNILGKGAYDSLEELGAEFGIDFDWNGEENS